MRKANRLKKERPRPIPKTISGVLQRREGFALATGRNCFKSQLPARRGVRYTMLSPVVWWKLFFCTLHSIDRPPEDAFS
jgi:hypothetical protein